MPEVGISNVVLVMPTVDAKVVPEKSGEPGIGDEPGHRRRGREVGAGEIARVRQVDEREVAGGQVVAVEALPSSG